MAWWDTQDAEFQRFMANLFTPTPAAPWDPSDPIPGSFIAKDPKAPAMIKGVVKDAAATVSKGMAAKAAVPAAAPSPSSTQPIRPTIQKDVTGALQTIMDQAGAVYAAQKGPGAKAVGLTDESLLWIPKWEVYKGQQEAGKGRFLPTTMGAALEDFQTWDDKKLLAFSKKLQAAGVLDEPTINHDKLEPFWESLVGRSAKMYSAGRKMNPWDILARLSDSGGGGYGLPKTTTSTNTQYTVTSALTAKQLAHAALSARLGRDATESEVGDFTKALAAAEKKNPSSTTTTTTTNAAGTSQTSTSTQKEGLDPRQFAEDYGLSHNKEESKAYQAAGYYMPAFFEALGATV